MPPTLPLSGNPNVFDGRQPTLIPNLYGVYIENGITQAESPSQMQSLHPTSGLITCMVPTKNFTFICNGKVVSFFYGQTYEIGTALYTEMVAMGMPVTS